MDYPKPFSDAMVRVLRDEGGYVNDPMDPGGETKYGISKRSYPNLDIKNLTLDQATVIYFRDWWQGKDFYLLPDALSGEVFDIAINVGPAPAVKFLERACRACGCGVADDGKLFSVLPAVKALATRTAELLAAFKSEAAAYYRILAATHPADRKFLKGWLARAAE